MTFIKFHIRLSLPTHDFQVLDCPPGFQNRDAELNNHFEIWKCRHRMSIHEAICLTVGIEPTRSYFEIHGNDQHLYDSLSALASEAIQYGRLKPDTLFLEQVLFSIPSDNHLELYLSYWTKLNVHRRAYAAWLTAEGMKSDFFESNSDDESVVPQDHNSFPPKLQAAIAANRYAKEPENRRGRSFKDACKVFLKNNAETYGLVKEDGKPNALAIEECAKIANEVQKGGAPKTPEPIQTD